jgi:dipeptidyl aminopeptidase/acylaminoacyl peptidase
LITLNSYSSPNEAFLLHVPASSREQPKLKQLSAITTGLVEPLQLTEAEEFWFSGATPDKQVHGFIIKPHGYEEGKKYGLAFLVHGGTSAIQLLDEMSSFCLVVGPQSAWASSWSTRWNPAVWAAAGYVVVAINPTGSTGYGQDFTDAINKDWGGKPFKDLVAGLEFVKRAYKDIIDEERMVMAGASVSAPRMYMLSTSAYASSCEQYGGYMANWIQVSLDRCGFS